MFLKIKWLNISQFDKLFLSVNLVFLNVSKMCYSILLLVVFSVT